MGETFKKVDINLGGKESSISSPCFYVIFLDINLHDSEIILCANSHKPSTVKNILYPI